MSWISWYAWNASVGGQDTIVFAWQSLNHLLWDCRSQDYIILLRFEEHYSSPICTLAFFRPLNICWHITMHNITFALCICQRKVITSLEDGASSLKYVCTFSITSPKANICYFMYLLHRRVGEQKLCSIIFIYSWNLSIDALYRKICITYFISWESYSGNLVKTNNYFTVLQKSRNRHNEEWFELFTTAIHI